MPILLAAGAYALYHVAQKLTPGQANPFLALAVSFATATLGCLMLFAFSRPGPLGSELAKLNWTSPAVGLSVLAIETGFLLAYRQGWKVGVTALIVTTAVTLILLPVGRFGFGERLSRPGWLGAALALAGLALLAR